MAADFTFGRLDPSDTTGLEDIVLSGEIKGGDYESLKAFAKKDGLFWARTVVLASPGGDLLEAIRIGNFLRKTFTPVFVNPKVGKCASACFLIYVAAVRRSGVASSLGIHRPYFSPLDFGRLPLEEVQKKHDQLMAAVKSHLQAQQVPHYLIDKMFSLASTEVYWLNEDDLDSLGLRANWWDQVMVDRCGLDKTLEKEFISRGYLSPRAQLALAHIHKVAQCGYSISKQETERNLKALLAP